MSILTYRMGGSGSPVGKTKIYISCHSDDREKVVERILPELSSMEDYAICWYSFSEGPYDPKALTEELSDVQLFLVPVTLQYLKNNCRAKNFEYGFAMEHGIPVIPVLMAAGFGLYFQDCMNRIGEGWGAVPVLDWIGAELIGETGAGNRLLREQIKSEFSGKVSEQTAVQEAELRDRAEQLHAWAVEALRQADGISMQERLLNEESRSEYHHLLKYARSCCEREIRIRDQLAAGETRPGDRHLQMLAYCMLGSFVGDYILDAAELYDMNGWQIALAEVNESGSAEARSDLSHAWNELGLVHARKNENEKARQCFWKALELRRVLFRENADEENMRNLAFELEIVAGRYEEDPEKQEAMYREALELRRKLAAENGVSGHVYNLAYCLYDLGGLCYEMGRNREAKAMYQEAIALLQPIKESEEVQTLLWDLDMAMEEVQ